MKQLVYRQERDNLFETTHEDLRAFRYLNSMLDIFPVLRQLQQQFGLCGVIKAGLKLATRKRKFYCVIDEGGVAHYGWVSISFCRHYSVGKDDVVIGPIMTNERARGRGLATFAIKHVTNALIALGYRVFWIDTSEDNIACKKVIQKCGFGNPVVSYERPEDGL